MSYDLVPDDADVFVCESIAIAMYAVVMDVPCWSDCISVWC